MGQRGHRPLCPSRLVLIDSLNALHWTPRAYLDLAQRHESVHFVMCHAGGYDIVEFVKMCRFLPNVWLDFSVTQHEFGWVSGRRSPHYIGDVIDHALQERRTAPRILFGSDYPLLPQADAVSASDGSPRPRTISHPELHPPP